MSVHAVVFVLAEEPVSARAKLSFLRGVVCLGVCLCFASSASSLQAVRHQSVRGVDERRGPKAASRDGLPAGLPASLPRYRSLSLQKRADANLRDCKHIFFLGGGFPPLPPSPFTLLLYFFVLFVGTLKKFNKKIEN